MIVMKFGGTSVGTAKGIKCTLRIIKSALDARPVVIVSALSGVTDMIISAANDAARGNVSTATLHERHFSMMRGLGIDVPEIAEDLEELHRVLLSISIVRKVLPELYAMAVSFGERMSSKIVAAYARKEGLDATAYNSYDLGLVTDSEYNEANVLPETYKLIPSRFGSLRETEIPIITGFIAKDADGSITTLGRGGSDYTATIFGISLNASEIQVWTDVDGMMTADPRIVPEARTIAKVSFREASELAYFGAKVLHPKTIYPAVSKGIPVKVINTFRPECPGTTIVDEVPEHGLITAIACKRGITTINISSPKMLFAYGFMERIFNIFALHKISVDIVSTSEVSVSVTVDGKFSIEKLVSDLLEFASVEVSTGRASISVVGYGMKQTPGNAEVIFSALGSAGINVEMVSMGASDINLTFVVKESDVDAAMKLLHSAFFSDNAKNYKKEAATAGLG